MKRLLIIRREQFGYHTDVFKWCEYLRYKYDVSTVTFGGLPEVAIDNVSNHYVPSLPFRTLRGALFMLTCLWHIMLSQAVIVSYFPKCEVLKRIFFWKKMILDVRTMSVEKDPIKRDAADKSIRKAARIFDVCTPISEGVCKKLDVPDEKAVILPLGADVIDSDAKSYESLNLLYIGTLTNRNIDKTVRGFHLALNSLPKDVDIHYDIIGDGKNRELEQLTDSVHTLGLDSFISIHGYIRHDLANEYFKKCNIGISFVPMTPYFEYQPVTKTFEYALSGLYTIGTATYSNQRVITPENGILINDNEQEFAKAICDIYAIRNQLKSDAIRSSLSSYVWKNIVEGILSDVIEKTYFY